jgi:hypothetical protein
MLKKYKLVHALSWLTSCFCPAHLLAFAPQRFTAAISANSWRWPKPLSHRARQHLAAI